MRTGRLLLLPQPPLPLQHRLVFGVELAAFVALSPVALLLLMLVKMLLVVVLLLVRGISLVGVPRAGLVRELLLLPLPLLRLVIVLLMLQVLLPLLGRLVLHHVYALVARLALLDNLLRVPVVPQRGSCGALVGAGGGMLAVPSMVLRLLLPMLLIVRLLLMLLGVVRVRIVGVSLARRLQLLMVLVLLASLVRVDLSGRSFVVLLLMMMMIIVVRLRLLLLVVVERSGCVVAMSLLPLLTQRAAKLVVSGLLRVRWPLTALLVRVRR